MQKTSAPQPTTEEMLDALEAAIAAARLRNGHSAPPPEPGVIDPAGLRTEMENAGVSAGDLVSVLGVPQKELNAWLSGHAAVPYWVPAAIRLLALLKAPARRKALNGAPAGATARPARTHPFTRIEEL